MATINAQSREGAGKGVARKLRREGRVPAVLYGGGKQNRNLSLSAKEWYDLVEKEGSGLRTNRQSLVIDSEVRVMVLLRGFQVHPLKGTAVHVDFARFDPNQKIEVSIPVSVVGEDVCPGVKAGGIVQTVRRELDISCLAGNLPDQIVVSIEKLEIGDSIHIEDIQLPQGVEVHTEVNFTIVTVVGVKAEAVETEEVEEVVVEGETPEA